MVRRKLVGCVENIEKAVAWANSILSAHTIIHQAPAAPAPAMPPPPYARIASESEEEGDVFYSPDHAAQEGDKQAFFPASPPAQSALTPTAVGIVESLEAQLRDQVLSSPLQFPCIFWYDTNPHLSVAEREGAEAAGVTVYTFSTSEELLANVRAHGEEIRGRPHEFRVLMNSVPFLHAHVAADVRAVAPVDVLVYCMSNETVRKVLSRVAAGVQCTNDPRRCYMFVTFAD